MSVPVLLDRFHKPHGQHLGLGAREGTDVLREPISDSHAKSIVEGHGNMQRN